MKINTLFGHPDSLDWIRLTAGKTSFFIYLLGWLLGHSGWAQSRSYLLSDLLPIDSETGDIVYLGVVPIGGASITELQQRARTFLAKKVRPGSWVSFAHLSDKQVGGRGIISLAERKAGLRNYQAYRVTLEIKLKEGQYRYQLSEFSAYPDSLSGPVSDRQLHRYDPGAYTFDKRQANRLRAWDRSVQTYLATLRQYMMGKSKGG